MTPSQEAAFNSGGGGNYFTADNLFSAISLIGGTAIVLYVAWLVVQSYNEYGDGEISASNMLFIWARGVFILLIFLSIFR